MEAFRIDLQCKYRRFKNAQSGFEHSRVLEAALKSKHAMWCMCQRAGRAAAALCSGRCEISHAEALQQPSTHLAKTQLMDTDAASISIARVDVTSSTRPPLRGD